MLNRLILAAAATGALSTAASAGACAPRAHLVTQLIERYGENFAGGGLQGQAAVYEVWTSEADGTWTILLTRPDGVSCVMASGTDWLPQLERHIVKGVPS